MTCEFERKTLLCEGETWFFRVVINIFVNIPLKKNNNQKTALCVITLLQLPPHGLGGVYMIPGQHIPFCLDAVWTQRALLGCYWTYNGTRMTQLDYLTIIGFTLLRYFLFWTICFSGLLTYCRIIIITNCLELFRRIPQQWMYAFIRMCSVVRAAELSTGPWCWSAWGGQVRAVFPLSPCWKGRVVARRIGFLLSSYLFSPFRFFSHNSVCSISIVIICWPMRGSPPIIKLHYRLVINGVHGIVNNELSSFQQPYVRNGKVKCYHPF